jgi:hypothetical protein
VRLLAQNERHGLLAASSRSPRDEIGRIGLAEAKLSKGEFVDRDVMNVVSVEERRWKEGTVQERRGLIDPGNEGFSVKIVAEGRRGLALMTIVDDDIDVDANNSKTGRSCCCRRFGHRRCLGRMDRFGFLALPSQGAGLRSSSLVQSQIVQATTADGVG